MSTVTLCDAIIRGSIDGAFYVVDAKKQDHIAGRLLLLQAVEFARQTGAQHIYQLSTGSRFAREAYG
jgi:hypothetical protein